MEKRRSDCPDRDRRVVPFSEMNNLHTQMLLWIPTGMFYYITVSERNWNSWKFDGCSWDFLPEPIEAPPSCAMKDILARPNYCYYAFMVFVICYTFLLYHRSLRTLKKLAFGLAMLLIMAVQCLSSFSGYVTSSWGYWLPFNWNSYGRPIWLWFLVECAVWNYSYLRTYTDFYFRPDSRTVVNEIGSVVWTFTSELTGDPEIDETYSPYSPLFLPWQDVVVRLAYIQLVDGLIQILWLRYGFKYGSYTTYINNFEILLFILFLTLAVYTYARMRTHLVLTEADKSYSEIKSGAPFSERSITKDLFTISSPVLEFRSTSLVRQCAVFFAVLFAALVLATLHTWMVFVWAIFFNTAAFAMTKRMHEMDGYTKEQAAELARRDINIYRV